MTTTDPAHPANSNSNSNSTTAPGTPPTPARSTPTANETTRLIAELAIGSNRRLEIREPYFAGRNCCDLIVATDRGDHVRRLAVGLRRREVVELAQLLLKQWLDCGPPDGPQVEAQAPLTFVGPPRRAAGQARRHHEDLPAHRPGVPSGRVAP